MKAPKKSPQIKRLFQEYYLKQGVVTKEELEGFLKILQTPLPTCFRVNPNGIYAEQIKTKIAEYFQFEAEEVNGLEISPPKCLSWYPEKNSVWQIDCGRSGLSKAARLNGNACIQELHKFIVMHTHSGNLSRQESVSMIPPLLLQVNSKHRVLDMCASPGSKTAQLLESLLSDNYLQSIVSTADASTFGSSDKTNFLHQAARNQGFIVANDANEKRAYLLVHQLQRLGFGLDSSATVVTCHPGQNFPGLYSVVTSTLQKSGVFDRILCDVPCSGDGTIRKNPNILSHTWHVGSGLTLHPIQIELSLRAACLLKEDGMMVYSTCTFNPVENEAVLAELLRRSDGALELVDCSNELPGLIRRPGLHKWSVGWYKTDNTEDLPENQEISWYNTYDDVPMKLREARVVPSMFPTSTSQYHLERCMRFLPMDSNTGGFFVALLKKTKRLPTKWVKNEHGVDEEVEVGLPFLQYPLKMRIPGPGYICKICKQAGHFIKDCSIYSSNRRKSPIKSKSSQVVRYQKLDKKHWDIIQSFYGLKSSFPHESLYARSDGSSTITFVLKNVQQECLTRHDLQVINTGLKMFTRVSKGSDEIIFRPNQEGLQVLLPYITKRLIEANFEEVDNILNVTSGKSLSFDYLRDNNLCSAKFLDNVSNCSIGPAVLYVRGKEELVTSVWIGGQSIAPLLSKEKLETIKDRIRAVRLI